MLGRAGNTREIGDPADRQHQYIVLKRFASLL